MLQITSIEIYKLLIPLKEPFVISLGTQFNADNVLIVIKTNEELIGWGECSPYMSINGESVETCFAVAQYLAKVLIGKNPTEIEDCIVAMDKVIYGNNSIKSAFDMALYDLAAQHKGLPLYKFLGGRKDKIITTDMTVGIGSPEKMAADALRFKEAGFPAIKVKLGQSTEIDVARIKAIRLAVGNELPLRIDANQGWTVPTAIATLQSLEPYNIEHCEEPIARWNFMELSKVKQASPVKIMADESCCTQHDANRLATLQACDYFNIKLGKSGGIFNALQIVAAGNNHNIKLQIGSFMESRLATTAFVHFAFCNASIVHFDVDTPLMMAEDPIENGLHYLPNGVVTIDDTPGIGASIDTAYLKSLEQAIIQ